MRRALVLLLLLAASGCAARRAVTTSTNEALYRRAVGFIQQEKYLKARKLLGNVGLAEAIDPELDPSVKIALADSYFFQGGGLNVIEAQSRYQQFLSFYPTHRLAAYAQYQVGVCLLIQSEAPQNDQAFTRRAIEELRKVAAIDPRSPYAWAALSKLREAEDKLAESEWLVARFYARRRAWDAVIGRLQGLLESYPAYSDKEKVFYHLGRALIETGNPIEGRIYLEKLRADFPQGEYDEPARGLLEQTEAPSAG